MTIGGTAATWPAARPERPAPPQAAATGAADATQALDTLAQSLGLDPEELLAKLTSGDTAAVKTLGGYTATGRDASCGLVVDQYA